MIVPRLIGLLVAPAAPAVGRLINATGAVYTVAGRVAAYGATHWRFVVIGVGVLVPTLVLASITLRRVQE